MRRYNPKEIEPRWQKIWADSEIYQADENKKRPKRYVLEYFPYPSGVAMHVGHVRNYTIGDVLSRASRMRGFNVLHPMGWDAFGLPAENYAIKSGISPQKAVAANVANFKRQLMQMGFSYDWSREINSTDPGYYKWTQWLFLLLFERGLAYQKESLQWWCPVDKTVLANEQVEDGHCWRCGSLVEKKALKQWFFKITDYADRLEKDLDNLNWSEAIKTMQRNWIGRSEGAEIDFELDGKNEKITVFTTRPDTVFGATFLVLAPEHKLLNLLSISKNKPDVSNYIDKALRKTEIDRMDDGKEKSGVFTGLYAVNPATKEKIPVWVADYVLPGYGTGAIMAVPAHDERDWQFAKKFDLPIRHVYDQEGYDDSEWHAGEGVMKNSADYDGLTTPEARERITAGLGKAITYFKMHDWLISRQRYWGAPIPIIHCPEHGPVAVPDKDLPVVLPEVKSYEPSGDGRSPLANVSEFVDVKCPKCGGPASRETDTMDGFACSSWYFLRFADPHNSDQPFSKDKIEHWLPVDDYIGGAEHAVMHLLYARFWTKVMYDAELIGFDEPFTTLRNHGMILAPDGQKMSKSKNNTIEPDELIEQGYGADSIRLMELFIGPWNQTANWSVEGLSGMHRFLQRVWVLVFEFLESEKNPVAAAPTAGHNTELEIAVSKPVDKAAKKVSSDLEELGFNTALSAMMEAVNELYKLKGEHNFMVAPGSWKNSLQKLILILAPFAPHITEELWQAMGQTGSVHISRWPSWDESLISEDLITIVVQVNGKVRSQILVAAGTDEAEIVHSAKKDEKIVRAVSKKKIIKAIYVPGRLVNLVLG